MRNAKPQNTCHEKSSTKEDFLYTKKLNGTCRNREWVYIDRDKEHLENEGNC